MVDLNDIARLMEQVLNESARCREQMAALLAAAARLEARMNEAVEEARAINRDRGELGPVEG